MGRDMGIGKMMGFMWGGGMDLMPYHKTLFQFYRFFDMWIICDVHTHKCSCSYCQEFKEGLHLVLPQDKSWNSWRILYFKTRMRMICLRWILPRAIWLRNAVDIVNILMDDKVIQGQRVTIGTWQIGSPKTDNKSLKEWEDIWG
jgi:hypothetical protein